jgi:hypothetical protein
VERLSLVIIVTLSFTELMAEAIAEAVVAK